MTLLFTVIVTFFAGMGAGLGTGFAGMSAAAVISPMLITFLGFPAYQAVAISLASDVLASAASAYTYGKNRNLDIRNGLVMLAAVLAEGRTVLHNAAREPEICDLAAFLRGCGADISGDGESTIVISGVRKLRGSRHTIMPDRIAGVTYLGAAAITGGTLCLRGVSTQPMENMLPVLEQTGCRVFPEPDRLHLLAPRRLRAVPFLRTMPHPGFPTDAQAIFMAMLSLADGVSVLEENIFENRYRHVDALVKMGAKIRVSGRIAVVTGVRSLSGASVAATDLRGGAAMVLAGLGAQGKTEVRQIAHIDRGYEAIEQALQGVGAKISRVETAPVSESAGRTDTKTCRIGKH